MMSRICSKTNPVAKTLNYCLLVDFEGILCGFAAINYGHNKSDHEFLNGVYMRNYVNQLVYIRTNHEANPLNKYNIIKTYITNIMQLV